LPSSGEYDKIQLAGGTSSHPPKKTLKERVLVKRLTVTQQNELRERIYTQLQEIFKDSVRIVEGLALELEVEGQEQIVVIRAIVKNMEKFDLDDALMEYEDKLAKQKEKEEEKAKKEAERKAKAEAKKAEAEAKKAKK
jgi:antitoxin component of MazEF toxin-antitoxin module